MIYAPNSNTGPPHDGERLLIAANFLVRLQQHGALFVHWGLQLGMLQLNLGL